MASYFRHLSDPAPADDAVSRTAQYIRPPGIPPRRAFGVPTVAQIEMAVEHDTALPLRVAKTVQIEPAVEHDIALPIRAVKTVATPPSPGATPAERRRWIEEEALIIGWASSGGFLGALLGGRLGGILCFLLAGIHAAVKVTRRT